MTLYKGPIVDFIRFGGGGGGGGDGAGGASHGAAAADLDQHWIPGTLMLLGRTFGWAGFFILQVSTKLTHNFPVYSLNILGKRI